MVLLSLLLTSVISKCIAQRPESLPDLDVTYIERTPRYPGYLPSYDVKGMEGVPILLNEKTRRPLSAGEAKHMKRNPAEGETVTFTAHTVNKGLVPSGPFEYLWLLDGKTIASGKIGDSLPVGKEATVQLKWKWQTGRHTIKFIADPLFKIRDLTLTNNSREDAIDAWSLIFAVDRNVYDAFNKLRNIVGTRSFEDWAQWHIDRMNNLFATSPGVSMSTSSNPIRPAVRCDGVVVVDNIDQAWEKTLGTGIAPLKAGYDGAWSFGPRENYAEWAGNADWGLIHEWGHQLGLTDEYALDRPGFENFVPNEDGFPLLVGHRSSQAGYMMHGHGPTLFSPLTEQALIYQVGRRRGFYGDYYFVMPKISKLRIHDNTGKPLAKTMIEIWQDHDGRFDGKPLTSGSTDSRGLITLPNRPAPHIKTDQGFEQIDNPFGKINVVGAGDTLLLKLKSGGSTEYRFMDIAEFNIARFLDHSDVHIFDIPTHFAPANALQAPKGLVSNEVGDKLSLTWNSMKPGITYEILEAGRDDFDFVPIGTSIANRFETQLEFGNVSRYAVRAIDNARRKSSLSKTVVSIPLKEPWGIVVRNDGSVMVRDSGYGQNVWLDKNLQTIGLAGSFHYHFEGSYDFAMDSTGKTYNAKWGDGYSPKQGFKVQDSNLKELFTYMETPGREPGHFSGPMGIGVSKKGHIYVADTGNHRIQEFSNDGKFVQVIGVGELRLPMKTAFDSKGRLYVADSGFNRIAVYEQQPNQSWKFIKSLMDGIKEPCYVMVDANDRVFVSTNRVAGVYMFGPNDKIAWTYKSPNNDPVASPRGLAMNRSGKLLIVDAAARRIVVAEPPKP